MLERKQKGMFFTNQKYHTISHFVQKVLQKIVKIRLARSADKVQPELLKNIEFELIQFLQYSKMFEKSSHKLIFRYDFFNELAGRSTKARQRDCSLACTVP